MYVQSNIDEHKLAAAARLKLSNFKVCQTLSFNIFFNDFFFSSDECGWCKRPVSFGSTEFLASPEGLVYCTESCFTQSRRASFKRARTCDWCKHIRHAISYVDFLDGVTQLQFCSDKCLNQYKMQIFCKETQAHLDMNPHLKETGPVSSNALITPDLWLKDCRSRSASPSNSTHSRSSASPTVPIQAMCSAATKLAPDQLRSRPLISVTPASKLLSRPERLPFNAPHYSQSMPPRSSNMLQSSRFLRKRRSARLHLNARRMAGHAKGADEAFKSNVATERPKPIQMSNDEMARQAAAKNLLHSLETSPTKSGLLPRHQLLPPPPDLYPLNSYHRPHHQPFGFSHMGTAMQQTTTSKERHSPPNDLNAPPFPQSSTMGALHGASLPPMTLLVPCPIIVPFPVPIPIPLPFESFLKAANIKLNGEKTNTNSIYSNSTSSDANETSLELSNSPITRSVEQPLDCTKSRDAASTRGDCLDGINNEMGSNSDNSVDHKISSRLGSRQYVKRAINRESESSRPLRKRKRVIDSDFMMKSNI